MAHRQTSGDNRQRRKEAREARERGELPSEAGATTGATQQRKKVGKKEDHEERLAAKNKGKVPSTTRDRNEPRPGNRD